MQVMLHPIDASSVLKFVKFLGIVHSWLTETAQADCLKVHLSLHFMVAFQRSCQVTYLSTLYDLSRA